MPTLSIRHLFSFLGPFLVFWILFWLIPLGWGIDLSMQDPNMGISNLSGQEKVYVGFENFQRTLTDQKFYKALGNTSRYVLGSIAFIIPLSFLLAVALHELPRSIRGISAFFLLVPGLALPGVMSKLFYLFFHGREGALNQYLIMPLGMDPINWMMDPNFIMSSLVMQAVWRWTGVAALFFLCGLESIPRWHFELAKLEGFSFFAKLRFILIPGIRNLALFIVIFLIVDGVAAFSGAYTLLGGSGGMLDAGLLLVTYVYQVAFPGGSGRFDLPGAASMSLLVAPLLGGMLFILLKTKTFFLRT
ncbi:MAG: sugar ABC transporter permease [Verrucomicrobiota bacterium]|nr:sugar ABC transporter permease [Verrucomicrobiota bacterium]